MAFLRLSARNSFSSIGPSTGRTMTARFSAALMFKASLGLAMVTRPAPARSAPRAASRAAPVDDGPPETTTAWPREYLWPSVRACGNAFRQSAGTFANVVGLILSRTRSGIPISATSTTPQCRRPGRRKCPGLRRKNVTVSCALMAHPITAPVVPFTPLGKSTATMGTEAAFIKSMTLRAGPSTSRSSPAPNSASMIKSQFANASGDTSLTGSAPALCRQSGVTLQPLAFPNERKRSLPGRARPNSARQRSRRRHCYRGRRRPRRDALATILEAASATARPAFSINAMLGMPPATARRSASAISAVVSSSIICRKEYRRARRRTIRPNLLGPKRSFAAG